VSEGGNFEKKTRRLEGGRSAKKNSKTEYIPKKTGTPQEQEKTVRGPHRTRPEMKREDCAKNGSGDTLRCSTGSRSATPPPACKRRSSRTGKSYKKRRKGARESEYEGSLKELSPNAEWAKSNRRQRTPFPSGGTRGQATEVAEGGARI